MNTSGISVAGAYLETLPINKIAKYAKGGSKNGVPFTGYPQQHPADKNKLILIHDPLGSTPAILEFKLDDILFVEELSQAVTEKGEGIPMIKLWMKKGAHGVLLEPFDVDESARFMEAYRELKKRLMKSRKQEIV